MDLKELFKDVTSFNKEAAMKENMRMVELKDNVTANAFRDAQIKLASYVNVIKIDSPESNLTEFSRNKLSGKMKAMLSVSTTAGLKRLPIHFVVKASVPTMVETPEQVVAALDNVEGSIDKEVKEILEKQKQMAAYHNDDIEVKAEDEDNSLEGIIDAQLKADGLSKTDFTDKVDVNFYISLLEYGVVRNPQDGMTLLGSKVGEDEFGNPRFINYDYNYISVDDVKEALSDIAEGFWSFIGEENPEQVLNTLDNNNLSYWIMSINQYNGYFSPTASAIPGLVKKASKFTVQAKKKEIDLGVRENTSVSQCPVKLLVYPKTYLPELKKGDILNVGGFKYRYIGDEPTISGDTENGINARFELVVSTKKASLNVTAEDGEKKEDKKEENISPEEKQRRDAISENMREVSEMRKYIKGISQEDAANMSDYELIMLVLQCSDYNVQLPTFIKSEIGKRKNASLRYLSLPFISIFNLDDEQYSITKHIENSAADAYSVLKEHKEDLNKMTKFDDLPEMFKKVLKSDVGVEVKIANENHKLVDEEMAKDIIAKSPEAAIDLGLSVGKKYITNPVFQLFVDYCEEQDVSNKSKSDEELGLDGYEGYEPSDKDLSEIENESPLKEQSTKEVLDEQKNQQKQNEDYGADLSGLGSDIDRAIQEHNSESADEENNTQDILDDEDELRKEDQDKTPEQMAAEEKKKKKEQSGDVKKKTESEPVIEKDAEVVDDFTFSEKATRDNVDYSAIDDNILELLKQKYSQLKDIPNDWIEIYDADWYGTINWGIDIEAREWGLKSFNPVGLPSQLTGSFKVSYFANAEAADIDDSTEEYLDIDFDLKDITSEMDSAFTNGSDFFVKSIELTGINSAVLHF